MEAARRHDVTRYVARRVLRDAGVEIRPPSSYRCADAEHEQIALGAYARGLSIDKAAALAGMTGNSLGRLLAREGLAKRERGEARRIRLSNSDTVVAVKMYLDGASIRGIARGIGSSQGIVRRSLRDAGIDAARRGENARAFGAVGRYKTKAGYIRVKLPEDHPVRDMAGQDGYVMEHRLVMALDIGRPLEKNESVHHINGRRAENNRENLQLRTTHHGQGSAMCCKDCGSQNIGHVAL